MTDDEKKNRALAVETLYQIYRKYYPIWVREKTYREQEKSGEEIAHYSSAK